MENKNILERVQLNFKCIRLWIFDTKLTVMLIRLQLNTKKTGGGKVKEITFLNFILDKRGK